MPGSRKGSEICTEGDGRGWRAGCPRMPGCLAGVGDLHGRDRRAGCHAGHARLSVRGRRSVWKGSEANTLAAPILHI